MNSIEIMVEEHENIKKLLEIVRKASYKVVETKEVPYEDFEKIIDFIRNYADGHHHNKEEIYLFNRMVENLGALGEKTIKYGMLVEHDLGRLYVKNLDEALNKHKEGNKEAIIDIVANAVSYTDLLYRHIDKENNVIFKFAERELKKDIMDVINKECVEYEKERDNDRVKYLGILSELEKKYM